MNRMRIQKMLYIALFSALMTVSAWIAIPTPVPFTLQTFTFFLSIMMMGGLCGAVMSLIYVSLGIAGLPVFAGFGSGIGYILGASGGFILAFPISALLFALLERFLGSGKKRKLVYAAISLLLIYATGSLWFSLVYTESSGFFAALAICMLPYVLPDSLKIFLAYHVSERLKIFKT